MGGWDKGEKKKKELTCSYHCVISICLEKEMATHYSILAQEIPCTGDTGGLLSLVAKSWTQLGTYTQFKAETQTDICTPMFSTTLFTAAKIQKQFK